MRKYLNYNILYLILIFLCLISFFGAVIYRLYSLNNIGVIISLILAITTFFIIQRFDKKRNNYITEHAKINTQQNNKTTTITILLLIIYCLLLALSFYTLFIHQTAQAIISPWQVIPNYFFIFYGLATAVLVLNILKHQRFSLLLITLHYFLSFSIAWIVYKIGYGFDPFIHQTTVDLISKTGTIMPKPFYYLGQYSLIVILNKITALPLIWLDKLLVPLLSAVYLPVVSYQVFKKWFDNNIASLLLLAVVLILPFSFFIVTTPQNLAYLLLLLIILQGLICKNIFDLIIIYLFALTALLIQPIAGIPAVLFALLLTVYHSDTEKIKKYGYLLIFILSVIALPLAFYFVEKNNTATETINKLSQEKFISLPKLIVPNQENFILNFIYLYGFNLKIIISLLVIIGIIIACFHKKECKIFSAYFIMSAALGLSYLLTKNLPFNFLIEYERNNYTDRILLMTVFFFLPFIIVALYAFIKRVIIQNKAIKIPILIFLIILSATSLYLSYPRFDRYFNSHGYCVSASDIKATHWIKDNAEKDYIVLANQQVSAAALREFGFAKYYKNNIFYYPIPTGGPMYQYFLDMIYKKPSRETMLAAMDLAGVSEGYFVLNKYWWAFPKILAEAKLEANSWQKIDNGEIFIFKYRKTQ